MMGPKNKPALLVRKKNKSQVESRYDLNNTHPHRLHIKIYKKNSYITISNTYHLSKNMIKSSIDLKST